MAKSQSFKGSTKYYFFRGWWRLAIPDRPGFIRDAIYRWLCTCIKGVYIADFIALLFIDVYGKTIWHTPCVFL